MHDFKHVMPRLLELTIDHRDAFLVIAVVFGRLAIGEYESWPASEQVAVNQFLMAYWRYQLSFPIDSAHYQLNEIQSALVDGKSRLDQRLNAKVFGAVHIQP
ncbi:MAG: hypothetical protein AB8G99_27340 [Planctomycetaceae bacterium]